MTPIEGSRAEAELPSEEPEPEPGPGEPRQSTASWQPLTARAGSELPSLHNGARSPARPRQGPCHWLARWPWQWVSRQQRASGWLTTKTSRQPRSCCNHNTKPRKLDSHADIAALRSDGCAIGCSSCKHPGQGCPFGWSHFNYECRAEGWRNPTCAACLRRHVCRAAVCCRLSVLLLLLLLPSSFPGSDKTCALLGGDLELPAASPPPSFQPDRQIASRRLHKRVGRCAAGCQLIENAASGRLLPLTRSPAVTCGSCGPNPPTSTHTQPTPTHDPCPPSRRGAAWPQAATAGCSFRLQLLTRQWPRSDPLSVPPPACKPVTSPESRQTRRCRCAPAFYFPTISPQQNPNKCPWCVGDGASDAWQPPDDDDGNWWARQRHSGQRGPSKRPKQPSTGSSTQPSNSTTTTTTSTQHQLRSAPAPTLAPASTPHPHPPTPTTITQQSVRLKATDRSSAGIPPAAAFHEVVIGLAQEPHRP